MKTEWTDVSIDPTISGKYYVMHLHGYGYATFIVGKGWQITEDIKDFYVILAWQEYEDTFNF